jgi:hypothetical protein
LTRLAHEDICFGCRRRRHYHHEPCPGCGARRPLAYRLSGGEDASVLCASCAGAESIFACSECGREDHPYGANRCARCFLRERLADLLTDPATGQVHVRLQPVFDALISAERPQTSVYWLRRPPGDGPRLLGQMARGEVRISHDTFSSLPCDRPHNYVRDLLAALGVLPAYEPRIARIERWLDDKVAGLPAEQSDLIRRFARWRVLRHLRTVAAQGPISKATTDRAREQISAAIRLLTFFDEHGVTATTATQATLEDYQATARVMTLASEHAFVTWLRTSRTNTALTARAGPWQVPAVTVSEEDRWRGVARLLHDTALRRYTRIGGLFTLLFAQPLSRIVAMRTTQVILTADGCVEVTFNTVPIPMPAILDDLVREHLNERGLSQYGRENSDWFFPGGQPGGHLQTENIRRQLVEIGIKPLESRKATLFQLAAETPAPILAELLGTSDNNAANWARLAARDWTGYIADRAR